mgnify:CR=1 FL=1
MFSGILFSLAGLFVIFLVIFVIVIAVSVKLEEKKVAKMTPEERPAYREEKNREAKEKIREDNVTLHGYIYPQVIGPHCNTSGHVHAKKIRQKKGISGAKATGALLTGGASILATELSRKETNTEAYCSKCGQTWHYLNHFLTKQMHLTGASRRPKTSATLPRQVMVSFGKMIGTDHASNLDVLRNHRVDVFCGQQTTQEAAHSRQIPRARGCAGHTQR